MSESRHTITSLPVSDGLMIEDIEDLLPPPHPLARVRKHAAAILFERYCVDDPLTIRQLASFYGVTYQRIEQIIQESLDDLAAAGMDQHLPEDSRLRAAIVRRLAQAA